MTAHDETISNTLDLAVSHHKAGRFKEAEITYRQVLAAEPDNEHANHFLGILAAQAGLVGHITIGDGAIIAAQAGVAHNIREKEIVLGSPAFDIREFRKSAAIFKRLPEIRNTLIQLEKDLKEMKHRNNPDGSAGRRKK